MHVHNQNHNALGFVVQTSRIERACLNPGPKASKRLAAALNGPKGEGAPRIGPRPSIAPFIRRASK